MPPPGRDLRHNPPRRATSEGPARDRAPVRRRHARPPHRTSVAIASAMRRISPGFHVLACPSPVGNTVLPKAISPCAHSSEMKSGIPQRVLSRTYCCTRLAASAIRSGGSPVSQLRPVHQSARKNAHSAAQPAPGQLREELLRNLELALPIRIGAPARAPRSIARSFPRGKAARAGRPPVPPAFSRCPCSPSNCPQPHHPCQEYFLIRLLARLLPCRPSPRLLRQEPRNPTPTRKSRSPRP